MGALNIERDRPVTPRPPDHLQRSRGSERTRHMALHSARNAASSRPSDPPTRGAPGWTTWLPLFFVILSLVALALLPVLMERRVTVFEREIGMVLEPALGLAGEIGFTYAREMAALQGFLLSGEGRYRERYREALEQEAQVQDRLVALLEGARVPRGDGFLSLQARVLNLGTMSFTWRITHEDVLNEEISRDDFRRRFLPEDQAQYQELLAVIVDLRAAITQEVERARRRVQEARALQLRITVVLVVVALFAALMVGVLGHRLRSLIREGEARRLDAVRARREADALLAATGDGVFGVDLDGMCTFLNRAGAELLGYTPREVLGKDMHALVHHTRGDGLPNPKERCPVLWSLRTGEPARESDTVLWRKDGTSFPVRFMARPMVDGLETRGVVVTFTDMTEARRAEAALRSAVRARDEVVAVVSHDLRSPVGTVQLAASLLLDVPLPKAKQREQLTIIRRAAERMNRLIRDLLDIAKIEAGGLYVDAMPEDVEPIVDEAVQLARPLAEEKGLTVVAKLEGTLPRIRADKDRVLQVFSNLVGNAVRFTPSGGQVTLRASRANGEVVLSVEDNGAGIRQEDQEHLFDRFWQPRRGDRRGAGLGLAIVKGIVDAHGGRVWAESGGGQGHGSTFYFTLPVHPGT